MNKMSELAVCAVSEGLALFFCDRCFGFRMIRDEKEIYAGTLI